MITVVTFKWTSFGYRSVFTGETVNAVRRMVARHYPHPHRFVCVTDDPAGVGRDVEIVPLWQDFAHVPSPHGGRNPSCYRRLRIFHPDAGQWFGDRFVTIDLDTVIVGDLSPLWHRSEDIVLWGDTNPTTYYNGSMILLAAGARPQVWTEFDPVTSPALAKAAGQFGSDQAWISYRLGRGEAMWTQADGVVSYRKHIRPRGNELPSGARVVMFHGEHNPWDLGLRRVPWIRDHYYAEQEVA